MLIQVAEGFGPALVRSVKVDNFPDSTPTITRSLLHYAAAEGVLCVFWGALSQGSKGPPQVWILLVQPGLPIDCATF